MLYYSIKLVTLDDFRNYANMVCRFHIRGYALIGNEKILIGNFLEIMSHGPQHQMTMVLDMYREKEVPKMEAYMRKKGLLGKEICHAV